MVGIKDKEEVISPKLQKFLDDQEKQEKATDLYTLKGKHHSDHWCHNCSRTFIAILESYIDGQHECICPYCDHKHYRIIKNGVVTGERFDSDNSITNVKARTKISDRIRDPKSDGSLVTCSTDIFMKMRWNESMGNLAD